MPEDKVQQPPPPIEETGSEPTRTVGPENALSDISRRLAELAEQAKNLADQPLKEA